MIAPADCQPELALREQAQADDTTLLLQELCGLLRGRRFVTAAQIMKWRPGWDERAIRAIASASGGQVVSGPGMPGYCLLAEISTDDLRHAGNSLLSQGRAMARRGIALLRRVKLRELADA